MATYTQGLRRVWEGPGSACTPSLHSSSEWDVLGSNGVSAVRPWVSPEWGRPTVTPAGTMDRAGQAARSAPGNGVSRPLTPGKALQGLGEGWPRGATAGSL